MVSHFSLLWVILPWVFLCIELSDFRLFPKTEPRSEIAGLKDMTIFRLLLHITKLLSQEVTPVESLADYYGACLSVIVFIFGEKSLSLGIGSVCVYASVYMHWCTHACMCACVWMCMCMCAHAYRYRCLCTRTCISMYTCMYVWACAHMCAHACLCMCVLGVEGRSYHMFHIFNLALGQGGSPHVLSLSRTEGSLLKALAQSRLCDPMSAACFSTAPTPVHSSAIWLNLAQSSTSYLLTV